MPTLFRYIMICCLIAAAIYGAMVALVTFVEPRPRQVTIPVPLEQTRP
ncbi:hypothetical protein IFT84_13855 [Rhizobium sp. CFBP 8762]|nr:hypothetical protein [Rhizobium sp. CFBP 8762]MBD8555591.1 hypothetical protein [Rhizobium sp. CFBP 8762]